MKSPNLIQFAFLLFIIMFHLSFNEIFAQNINLKVVSHLPAVLKESSGIIMTKNGSLWTIVDSKLPVLYNINTDGQIVKFVYLNHKNKDWEDMTQDDAGNFYIGNFGNNNNKRTDLKIIKVPPPDSFSKIDSIINGDVIQYVYPDQKIFPPAASNLTFDMEAMVWLDNSLFLFSKNRSNPFTGYTKVYKLPSEPGKYTAQLIDSVNLGPGAMLNTWVTSAALSPDKKILALLTSDKVWLFYCFKGDRFFSGKRKTIELNNFSQKEAICFITNKELYITDELTKNIIGGNLYHLKLDKNYAAECK